MLVHEALNNHQDVHAQQLPTMPAFLYLTRAPTSPLALYRWDEAGTQGSLCATLQSSMKQTTLSGLANFWTSRDAAKTRTQEKYDTRRYNMPWHTPLQRAFRHRAQVPLCLQPDTVGHKPPWALYGLRPLGCERSRIREENINVQSSILRGSG